MSGDGSHCPDCGTVFEDGLFPAFLCPHCLLELALDVTSVETELFDAEAPTLATSPDTFAAGEIQGDRYRIRSLLGRGGMGEVWRAYDLKLRQDVALKVVLSKPTADASTPELEFVLHRDALRQEVRLAREVISPNVCRVFDLQELDGQELVSMEYIDGTTLAEILREKSPLDLEEARELASQFLAGLEAIHDAGLVHRDIKPENVMVTRTGRVVVMDFGIAKAQAEGQTGSVAGTPAYMSPEHAGTGELEARADVFSVGVMLAEMVDPGGVRSFEDRQRVWQGLQQESPEIAPTPWSRVIARCVDVDRMARYASAVELARALEEVTLRAADDKARPYPGLATFRQEEARFFFGRELEVEALWKKLRRPHLLAVIGPSGAGKSSFLRAGLLPALPDGWRAIVATPGDRPFRNLAQALAPEIGDAPGAADLLRRFEEPEVAVELLSEWRQAHDRVLVILDQFEELFTQNGADVQHRLAELLGRLPLETDVHVLLSMRDDFLFQCQTLEPLAPVFSEMTPLGAPTGASLRRAIVQPALKCGYRFESEALVEAMLSEVEGERGALPMLAFAAAQLWEERDRDSGLLTTEAYERIGGVGGALAQHAEATLERIGPDHLPIVRELFRNLVTAQGTRAVRDQSELLSVFGDRADGRRLTADSVLQTLVDARLLTSYETEGPNGGAAPHHVEIIHESLLSVWPRVLRWQAQDAEGAQLRDELRSQARLWDQHGRSEDYLWTGAAYLDYLAWRDRYPGGLTALEEAFGAAMRRLAERRRHRRRVALAASFAVLLVVLGVVGGFWRRSVAEARRAEASNLLSLAQVQLEDHPTAALAYATRSLGLADSPEARRLALQALSEGPTEFRIPTVSWVGTHFTPDGRWLIASGGDLWPSDGGPPSIREGEYAGMEFVVSPAGDLVAQLLGRGREELGVWSIPDGRLLNVRPLGGGGTFVLQFSADGQRVITFTQKPAGEVNTVEVRSWQVEGGEPSTVTRFEIPTSLGLVNALMDPSGSRLFMADVGGVRIVPLEDSTLNWASSSLLEHDAAVVTMNFDRSVSRLVTGDEKGSVRIWELAPDTPSLVFQAPGSPGEPPFLCLNPLGSKVGLKSFSLGGLLWMVDAPPGAEAIRLRRAAGSVLGEVREGGWGAAFLPDGNWLATVYTESISLWPLSRAYPAVLSGHEAQVSNLAFTPDGEWLVSSDVQGSVRLWPLGRVGKERPRVLYQTTGSFAHPYRLAAMPDGTAAVIGTTNGRVAIIPFDGGPVRDLRGFSDGITALAVGPEGRLVAAGGGQYDEKERLVRVWDLQSGTSSVLEAGGSALVNHLEFTPEGHLVSAIDKYRLWNLKGDSPELLSVRDQTSPKLIVDRSPDGGHGLTLADRVLWLSDLEAGSAREMIAHGTGVTSATFDPSGELIVSTDTQGVVRVDPGEGEPYLLLGHEGGVRTAVVSPDGRWIASAGEDKAIRIWPMPDLSRPPPHTLPHDELLATLFAQTNLRAVREPGSASGWKLERARFSGWETVPTW